MGISPAGCDDARIVPCLSWRLCSFHPMTLVKSINLLGRPQRYMLLSSDSRLLILMHITAHPPLRSP